MMEIFGSIWKYLEVLKKGIKFKNINNDIDNHKISIIIYIIYLHDKIIIPIWKYFWGGKGVSRWYYAVKKY